MKNGGESLVANRLLKAERERRGWSQQEVADKIGSTPLSVSRWESGITTPKPYFRYQLCDLFGKSIQELGLIPEQGTEDAWFKSDQKDLSHTSPCVLLDPAIPIAQDLSPLVGRDELLYRLKRRMRVRNSSLALHGLPGAGKTALARTLVSDPDQHEWFRDGILWVGLGPEPNLLSALRRWGTLLGLTTLEMAELTTLDRLTLALRDKIGTRRMLLIIDDVWDLGAALACKIGGMNCVHLVTTRFPPLALQFAGEDAFPVQELNEQDSLTLLQRLAPTVITDELHEAYNLIHSVGGLPLALTLIGRYLQVQAYDRQPRRVQKALEQLLHAEERLRLGEVQSFSERNPSLPAGVPLSLQMAIEVSDRQLASQTQAGLRALSVFPAKPNSFSESAALAICGITEEHIDQLTDAGLLESSSPGRYMLHQTIADYARFHRSDNSVEEVMVHFFVDFLAHSEHEQIEAEFNNILAALEIAEQRGLSAALQETVTLFAPFLVTRGLYTLAENYLEKALQTAQTTLDNSYLASIWLYLGQIATLRGEMQRAEQCYSRGLNMARQTEDHYTLGQLLAHAGGVIMDLGDYPRAESYLLEGLELASRLGQQKSTGTLLLRLGELMNCRGDTTQATVFYQEGLEVARLYEDWETMGALLQNLGVGAEWIGDYAQAQSYYEEAMSCAEKIGDRHRVSGIVMNMGMLAFRQRHYTRAEKCYREALELARKLENRFRESSVLQNLGMLERTRNNHKQAEGYLRKSLTLAREIGHDWLIHETLIELGELRLDQQKLDEAATIFQKVLAKAEQVEAKELVALALYGLARVAEQRHNYTEAQQKGLASQALFEHMTCERGNAIAQWLQRLTERSATPLLSNI